MCVEKHFVSPLTAIILVKNVYLKKRAGRLLQNLVLLFVTNCFFFYYNAIFGTFTQEQPFKMFKFIF